MKTDILAFAAHPDDVELAAAGTLLKEISKGRTVAIVDLTRGELGSRGTAETRREESENSTAILGISARENLGMADGFFEITRENLLSIVSMIRKYRPEIVLANADSDRHPDHGRAGALVSRACFLSGLRRIETALDDGTAQEAYRPKAVYHYIQDYYIEPDFVVDVSDFVEKKFEAIRAFKTQFYDPDSKEPQTPISGKEFFDFLRSRGQEFGRPIGSVYAEGFTTERFPAVDSLFDIG